MPKDNHSVMQLYLDGFQNNFFTFFHVMDEYSDKIKNDKILILTRIFKKKSV